VVGGTRPLISTAMVYSFIFNRFEVAVDEVDVRGHAPEDFIVRFCHLMDQECVLVAGPRGHLMPLVWRPWRRTSLASTGVF